MLSLLLIIFILLSIFCFVLAMHHLKNNASGAAATYFLILFVFSAILFTMLFMWVEKLYIICTESVIDQKIEMYQEENKNIEDKINLVVSSYMQHEEKIYTGIKPESFITLVSLYPDLKSDELVSKQIQVYEENTETIKKLKIQKISVSNDKWWIYFGH